MLKHQCLLSKHQAGRQRLHSMGIEHVEREISLRGYLLHGNRPDQDNHLPESLNPGLQQGRWFPLSKIIPLLDRSERWIPLPRLGWISPIDPVADDSFDPLEFAAYLREHFERSDSSIMICAVGDSESDRPAEIFRAMVTADSWPDCLQSDYQQAACIELSG